MPTLRYGMLFYLLIIITCTGQQQPPQQQQQQQFQAAYSYSYPPGYSVQGYQQGTAKTAAGSAVAQLYPAPGGYYIAGTAVVPSSTAAGKGMVGGGSIGGPTSQSYIYGPYGSYPYGPGRVIGPIIAIGKSVGPSSHWTHHRYR